MSKRILHFLVLLLFLTGGFSLYAVGEKEDPVVYPPEMDAWLQDAKLGPYEGEQDWDEIEKLANAEGEVIVYSSSSRIAKVAAVFEEEYPGIKVTFYDLGSVGTVEKTISEQDANLFNTDIITTGGSGQVIHELLGNNRLVNFVPEMFVDQIPEELREPLLARIVEGYVLMYNREFYGDTAPISNIWELTQDKWRGKVVVKDPMASLTNKMGLWTMVQHADEFDKAYEELTGEKLELHENVPDAGYEFIYRLLHNDLIILNSGSKVAKASGAKGQTDPPIAITGYTYIRYNASKDYVNALVTPLTPFENIITPVYTGIARQAPHPNAAKLFTKFLLGDVNITLDTVISEPYNEGESAKLLQGLGPYYEPGSKSPRDTVPVAKGGEGWYDLNSWTVDPDFMWYEGLKVQDFWVQEVGN
jgi:iron(III) transport system substrate-binding protein